MNVDNSKYFDCFRVEHVPKEIHQLIGNINITTNTCGIQTNYLILY